MRYKIIRTLSIFTLMLWCQWSSSQKDNSNYSIKVLSTKDSVEVSYAKITLISTDSIIQKGITDLEGSYEIENKSVDTSQNLQLEIEALGYRRIVISNSGWYTQKKSFIYIEPLPKELHEVIIIGYKTPLIDKMGYKKQEQIQPQEITYTKEEKKTYQSLQEGTWANTDSIREPVSLKFSELYGYLKKTIPYSHKVIDKLGVQEKIYLSFWINSSGEVTRIKLRKGFTPALILPVVDILSNLEFKLDPSEKKEYVKEEFLLPVKFVLH